jgi:hypothetical protein
MDDTEGSAARSASAVLLTFDPRRRACDAAGADGDSAARVLATRAACKSGDPAVVSEGAGGSSKKARVAHSDSSMRAARNK